MIAIEEVDPATVHGKSVPDLKELLRRYSLPVGGRKPELIARLLAAIGAAKDKDQSATSDVVPHAGGGDSAAAETDTAPASQDPGDHIEKRISKLPPAQRDLLVGARLRGEDMGQYAALLHSAVRDLPPPVLTGTQVVGDNRSVQTPFSQTLGVELLSPSA